MRSELIAHIHDLAVPPVLDVLGEWVHCRNARVATTSMDESALGDRCIIERRGRKNWESVWRHIIVPRFDQLLLFTFVRNPWDRICSAFFQCRDRARTEKNQIDRKWEFTDWVKHVLAVQWPAVNMHFAPQYDTMYYDGKPIPGMFVGRFERLEKDWAAVAARLRVRPTLPHWNGTGKRPYTEYYDRECVAIVGNLYAREIEALGYRYGD